jgi:trehalose-phosphatase
VSFISQTESFNKINIGINQFFID